jgi:hypothetical protein
MSSHESGTGPSGGVGLVTGDCRSTTGTGVVVRVVGCEVRSGNMSDELRQTILVNEPYL